MFKGDYISILKKKKECFEAKYEGYYQSIKNINQGYLWFADRIETPNRIISIAKNDRFVKRDVSILGDLGGMVLCGKPFLSEVTRS